MKVKKIFAHWWPVVSAFIGIVGIALAIIVIPGDTTISNKLLVFVSLIISIGYILMLVAIHNLMKVAKGSQNIDVAECYQDENVTYFSVEPYAGVGCDRYVSIYYRKSKQQRLIGIGVVDTIIHNYHNF